ncbi:MAG: SDR family NAD(P)-dependent oxidoreductase, partial [Clostridiales bacterium]|nr:SDR family NAD(P)-dependent oxidoreductase [Clostridiales bacterium]
MGHYSDFQDLTLQDAIKIAKENVRNRPKTSGRLAGKIAIVTGGAQGFGFGIAKEMVREGATVVLADLNEELAKAGAAQLGDRAAGIKADVSNAQSVERMVIETVARFGGLDIMLSNAGVLKAGALSEITQETFEFVTRVNYTGYFLCAKYASEIMKAQYEAD